MGMFDYGAAFQPKRCTCDIKVLFDEGCRCGGFEAERVAESESVVDSLMDVLQSPRTVGVLDHGRSRGARESTAQLSLGTFLWADCTSYTGVARISRSPSGSFVVVDSRNRCFGMSETPYTLDTLPTGVSALPEDMLVIVEKWSGDWVDLQTTQRVSDISSGRDAIIIRVDNDKQEVEVEYDMGGTETLDAQEFLDAFEW